MTFRTPAAGRTEPRRGDAGMTIVEVVVTIALLTVLTAATCMIVARATTKTVDNRARVAASALAQRELDLAATVLAASAEGIETLLNPQVAVNPNVTKAMASGDDEYAFRVDGQKFRVERTVQRRAIGAGSPCESAAGDPVKQFAALVEVKVTWLGMGATTKPHIASALFPPHAGVSAEELGEKAVVGVKVTGLEDPANPARPGIRVRATAPGFGQEAVTDARGCALFVLDPPQAGFNVDLAVLAQGSKTHVNLAGEAEPTITEHSVMPGQTRTVEFQNYDRAASLAVEVEGNPDVAEIWLRPAAGGAEDWISAPIVNGLAEFELLYPGVYHLGFDQATTAVPVTLAAGQHLIERLTIP